MLNRSALKPIIKIKAYDHVTEEFHNRMLYLFLCVSNKIVRKPLLFFIFLNYLILMSFIIAFHILYNQSL